MLVFAASAFLFAACDKPEPDPTPGPDDNTQTEVCDKCGKNPCECDTPAPTPTPSIPDWCDFYYTVDLSCAPTAVYAFADFKMNEIVDQVGGKTIHENLGFASWEELAEAIGTIDEARAFDREVLYFGYDVGSESDLLQPYNTNYFGYWVGENGALDAWGTETVRIFTEATGTDTDPAYHSGTVNVGVTHTGAIKSGDVYTCGLIIQKTTDGTVTRAGVQVTVTVEEFVDVEAGKYPTTATPGTHDIDFEGTITLSANEYDYDGPVFTEEFETVKEKLGMTTYEFFSAKADGFVPDDDGNLYTGMLCEGILPDGTVVEGTNFWLTADNTQTSWGADDAAVCIEWILGATPDELYGSACAMPSYYEVAEGEEAPDPSWYYGDAVKAAVGKTLKVTYRITYVPSDDNGLAGETTVINMNFAITVAE